MKEIISLPRKYNIIIFSSFGLFIALAIVFFTYQYYKFQNELAVLQTREVRGRITELKDVTRGDYVVT